MSDPAYALQLALVAALKGETEAGDAVYDMVPSDARQIEVAKHTFPIITLGSGQTINNPADCYDGSEAFLQIDVWSRKTGFPEVKQIAAEVRTILNDAELTLVGHRLDLMEVQDTVYSRDPDGKTSRARMTVRALTQAL